ncbi:MAG: serine/threonine-protein kinase [Bryobacterales bacterium]|nr:serine/threonine-protein kinase [Bryobacterales bacterium]
MTPQDYERVSQLFDQLQAVPESERPAALEAACPTQPQLRASVLQLLEADRKASQSFLERPAIETAARLLPSEPADLPEPGTTIGNYRLTASIGRGGMAEVFSAEDLRLGRRVAVKILPRQRTTAADRLERFHREARAISSLNHPNIVSIFDAATDQGYSYIAMEYVEGRTLRQILQPGNPLPELDTLLDWLAQIASALHTAHQAGLIHRDIKPENIMVRPDGFLKVLDFGLAKLFEPPSDPDNPPPALLTRPGNIAGTIQYLAPEQLSGSPATPQSDIFSLGVLAYELATRRRPFDGPTDAVIYNAILNTPPASPSCHRPDLPPAFDELVLRALEKVPSLRFQTAGDLRSACRRLLRDHTIRTSSGERLPVSPSTRRPFARYTLVTAFAALALAAWIGRPAPEPRAGNLAPVVQGNRQIRRFVVDSNRIYYNSGELDDTSQMYQVSGNGGEPVLMPHLKGMFPFDVSRDGAKLLLGRYTADAVPQWQVWVGSTVGSPPRLLPGLKAEAARWSPDGESIVYSNGPQLGVARADGSNARLLPVPHGYIRVPDWSPDHRRIRFSATHGGATTSWEVGVDGGGLRQVFAGRAHDDFAGLWSPDGHHFLFTLAADGIRRDLWLQQDRGPWFGLAAPRRWRLTNGPLIASEPAFRPDGRRVFFLGAHEQGELVRYDAAVSLWRPHIGGLAATQLEYSRDGKWITYMGPPGHSIWRSAADGTNRLQLSDASLIASNPRWSPDGSLITFFGNKPGQPSRIYVVPATGGSLRQVSHGEGGPGGETDASFSPDGQSLVYGVQMSDQTVSGQKFGLGIHNLASGRTTPLPGSEGLWSPRWSPDGRFIAALGFPNRIWVYDLTSSTRRQLTDIGGGFPSWSRDGQRLYFESGNTTTWYRLTLASRRLEALSSLRGLDTPPFSVGWVGLDANESLISTRDTSAVSIYAMDLEQP